MKGKGVTMMETGAIEGNSKKYSPSASLLKVTACCLSEECASTGGIITQRRMVER
jgi:hypothetical protein